MLKRRTLIFGLGCLLLVPGLLEAAAVRSISSRPAVAPTNTLTFFVASDLHYGWPLKGSNIVQRQLISELNRIPGLPYPEKLGGNVGSPRGVLLLGDLIQDGSSGNLAAWTKDWSSPERSIRFAVFEGIGNHDVRDRTSWSQLKSRNAARPGIQGVSSNGVHYSWTWSGIHFVMLNISPAEKGALAFLKEDLAERVGKKGEPVVLLQHYSVHAGKRWSAAQLDAFYEVVKGYNILCVMHGHTHHAKAYKWHGIDVLDDGALKEPAGQIPPSFVVVRVEGNHLTAVTRQVDGQWGKVLLEKTFARSAAELASRN